jgi:hypothetical protein
MAFTPRFPGTQRGEAVLKNLRAISVTVFGFPWRLQAANGYPAGDY